MEAEAAPIILYDGVCNLCNAWVRFVIRHDPAGRFRFGAQQSPAGQALLRARLPCPPDLSSVILLTDDAVYTKSSAILQIAAWLGPPWSWLAPLRLVPPLLRDGLYCFIVRHRYRWFGRTSDCQLPPPSIDSRFIR